MPMHALPAAAVALALVVPAAPAVAALAGSPSAVARPAAVAPATPGTTHTVRRGDSVSTIAHRYGTTVRAVVAANHLTGGGRMIHPGQRLVIPAAGQPAPVTPRAASRRGGQGSGHRVTRTLPAPTPGAAGSTDSGRPVRDRIDATARRRGVDPRLAVAIGYQESGWHQAARSSKGAIGTMQVMPANAEWLSHMAGRRLDLTQTDDNIDAGVLLLGYLGRRSTNLDVQIGAYYQGLSSMKKRGPLAETSRYVANVKALMNRG